MEMFCKKDVLKNLANFTGKHLRWSLFLIKLKNNYFEEYLRMVAFVQGVYRTNFTCRWQKDVSVNTNKSWFPLYICFESTIFFQDLYM